MSDFELHDSTPVCKLLLNHAAEALGFCPIGSVILFLESEQGLGPLLRYDLPEIPDSQWAASLASNAASALEGFLDGRVAVRLLVCPAVSREAQQKAEVGFHLAQMCLELGEVLHHALAPVTAVHLFPVESLEQEGSERRRCLAESVRAEAMEGIGCLTAQEVLSEAALLLGSQPASGEGISSQAFKEVCESLLAACACSASVPFLLQQRFCTAVLGEGNTEELLVLFLDQEEQFWRQNRLEHESVRRLQSLLFRWAALSSASGRAGLTPVALAVRLHSLAAWLYWLQGSASKAVAYLECSGVEEETAADPLAHAVFRLAQSGVVSSFARNQPRS